MPVQLDFLKNAWADTGDRVQFPYNPDTITELMSWIKGFTAKYQRLPEEGGVYIDRREFNQILYLLTKQIIDAFKITASDEQLDAETAARIEAINREKAERVEKDGNLQQQLNTKFMSVSDLSINFGVTYTAQRSGVILVDLEWGSAGAFTKPGCEYINAELICSNGANPQFVFACPYGWESSGQAPGGSRPNITLVTIIENGDTYRLTGETKFGQNGSSQIRVKSAKILY